jgi:nucleoside 2-deoxyribosyltransferase
MKIYLAGGITGIDDPNSWRKEAAEYLRKKADEYGVSVTILDPLRGKTPDKFKDYDYTPQEIVTRDKQDIRESDVILVEMMNMNHPYVGTSMEILYSYEHEKPVVLWSTYNSYWLKAHSVNQFDHLHKACDYILEFWR